MLRHTCAALAGLLSMTALAGATERAPTFLWSGPYAGVSLGYVGADGSLRRTVIANPDNFVNGLPSVPIQVPLATATPLRIGLGDGGLIGGAHAGYAAQFGQFVVGAEVDLSGTSLESSSRSESRYNDGVRFVTVALTSRSRMDWLGTARLRAGFAFERVHVYATGGLAFGHVAHRVVVTTTWSNGAPTFAGSTSETRVGYAIGAGAEYALTDALVLRGEYLFYDLGKTSVTAAAPAPVNASIGYRAQNRGHVARVGLSYRF